jgi:hypothetical protein
MPDHRGSTAPPNATNQSSRATIRRSVPSSAGSRGAGRGGGLGGRISCCSRRGGRSTASGPSDCGVRKACGSLRSVVSASGSGNRPSRRTGCGPSILTTCGRSTSSGDQTADGHNLKLLHVVDEFTRARPWRSSAAGGSMPTPSSTFSTVSCSSAGPPRRSCGATTARRRPLTRCGTGVALGGSGARLSSRAHHGRTPMSRASADGSVTSCSRSSCSRASLRPRCLSKTGATITTTTARTALSG